MARLTHITVHCIGFFDNNPEAVLIKTSRIEGARSVPTNSPTGMKYGGQFKALMCLTGDERHTLVVETPEEIDQLIRGEGPTAPIVLKYRDGDSGEERTFSFANAALADAFRQGVDWVNDSSVVEVTDEPTTGKD